MDTRNSPEMPPSRSVMQSGSQTQTSFSVRVGHHVCTEQRERKERRVSARSLLTRTANPQTHQALQRAGGETEFNGMREQTEDAAVDGDGSDGAVHLRRCRILFPVVRRVRSGHFVRNSEPSSVLQAVLMLIHATIHLCRISLTSGLFTSTVAGPAGPYCQGFHG